MGWISVKERLPEKKGEYLTVQEYRFKANEELKLTDDIKRRIIIEEFSDLKKGEWNSEAINFTHQAYISTGIVTHWMPLPEQPKQ